MSKSEDRTNRILTSKSNFIEMETVLWFGKHKGKKVKSIIKRDKMYFKWLFYNCIQYDFSSDIKLFLGIK